MHVKRQPNPILLLIQNTTEIKHAQPLPRYCISKRLKAAALERNTPFLQRDLQNTIYLLCQCRMPYVGETEQPFNRRMNMAFAVTKIVSQTSLLVAI